METVLNVVIADGNEAFAESLKSTIGGLYSGQRH